MPSARRIPGLDAVRSRVDAAIRWRAAEAVDPVARRAQELTDRVARVERTARWSQNELRRIAPQLAAVEARLADLDDRLRADPATAPDQRAALEAIAAEHARVRVRLAAVSSYEDRLRRLEEVLAPPAADPA